MSPRWSSSLVFAFAWVSLVTAQAIHTVTVGDTGSFYDPPVISALQGDIITFIFSGRSHSVTQSNFSTPCTRLPNGFDSDSWGVTNLTAGMPVPQWNLTITDITQTIWFYCKNTIPQSHCTAGMVGAINPPIGTDQNYTAFRAAAKAIPGTPVATPGAVLSGVGATATAVPTAIPLPGSFSASSSSSSTTTTSSTPSPTSTTTSSTPTPTSKSSNAAVVGGAVGGSLGGVILIGLIAFFIYMSRRRQPEPIMPRSSMRQRSMYDDDLYADPRPHTGPYSPPMQKPVGYRPPSPGAQSAQASSSGQAPVAEGMAHYQSQGSLAPLANETPTNSSGLANSNVNVRELAAEIATLMKQERKNLDAIDESDPNAPARKVRPLPQQPLTLSNRSQETLPIYHSGSAMSRDGR
ncbi:hypothetical protein SISSUDRAFT_1040997 [Sistotremastrum suecicum HHB10207 ss-3]|uniref:Cupredoxin n=1 Tax=Sistotremastrum suecicum HHB10207 ss-3 TaxID=1314776 RepID=A0A166HIH7_9AGAM|nr:hypothetical protein SISSUDRAFT_1040997 [Sistotremastrum suecicum HHB10207 ss-3]